MPRPAVIQGVSAQRYGGCRGAVSRPRTGRSQSPGRCADVAIHQDPDPIQSEPGPSHRGKRKGPTARRAALGRARRTMDPLPRSEGCGVMTSVEPPLLMREQQDDLLTDRAFVCIDPSLSEERNSWSACANVHFSMHRRTAPGRQLPVAILDSKTGHHQIAVVQRW